MKPKVALVKDGFLPPGSENMRGRLSGAAIERLKELAGSGWNIDGYTTSKCSVDSSVVKVEKSTAPDPARVYDVPEESRPEKNWQGFTPNGEVGMRTVCNTCKASLTYCRCQFPRVWVDHETEAVVVFKPRTAPLPNKMW